MKRILCVITCDSRDKNEHTHDIESLLRDPADVHIVYPDGAFLDFR